MKCCNKWNEKSHLVEHLGIDFCPWCGTRLGWPRIESTTTIGCATTYTNYAQSPSEKDKESAKEKRDRKSREKDRKFWGEYE